VFAVPVYGLLMITDDFGCCEKSLIMPLSRLGFPPRRDFFVSAGKPTPCKKKAPARASKYAGASQLEMAH